MRSITAKTIFFITLFALITSCISCSPKRFAPDHKAPLLEIIEIIEKEEVKAPIVGANMYMDNTQSMFGYVTRGELSNYVVTINSLFNLMEGLIDYSIYTLRPDKRNILVWQEISKTGSLNYYLRDFYTFRGVFEKRTDGPLQLLFDDESKVVDFDAINIFTTDLAEQNMRNIVLARRFNEIILERGDYAILVYCIQSQFRGMAAVPLPGVASATGQSLAMAVDNNFVGIRPFYLLLTGPTAEILKFNNDIANSLQNAGLKENDDFFRSVILPYRGVQPSDIADLITFHMEEDTKVYRISLAISNENYNFKSVTYEEIFKDIDRELPGINFAFVNKYTPDRKEKNHGQINLVLPLNSFADGSRAKDVSYWVDLSKIKVLGGLFRDASKHDNGSDLDNSYDKGNIDFAWEEVDNYTYSKFLHVESKFLEPGDVTFRVTEVTSDLAKSDFENEILYQVDSENGALMLKVIIQDIADIDYDYITLSLPVYGKVKQTGNIPSWVNDFNLTSRKPFNRNNPSATPEYFTKTDGLLEFYNLLLGNYTSSIEQEQYEREMEKVIAEVLINICLSWNE